MVAHPMAVIIAGFSCLGVGAATVTAVALTDGGEETSYEEQSPPANHDPQKQRYKELDDLRQECATKMGGSCTQLGLAYETHSDLWGRPIKGNGLTRDDRKAARYFRLACDYGDGNGCLNLV